LPAPDQIAFGKRPKKADRRTLLLSLSLSGGLLDGERPPAGPVDNENLVTQAWGDLDNNQLKDCAIAAAGHAEMLWAAKYKQPAANPTVDQIIDAYSKITGYDPADPTTDKGADLLSVLNYWKKTGIAGQKIGAFAEILPPDIETLRWAIDRLGLAYVGLRLSVATAAPRTGDIKPDFTAPRRWRDPATWQNPLYGHCVIYTGYSQDKDAAFTCVSWGTVRKVSEKFHRAYCEEAYAIVAPEQVEDGAATANPAVKALKEAVKNIH
jgi:hypothetical protein